MSFSTMKKIAVVGTGGSAQKFLNSTEFEGQIDFFNSIGEGRFNNQPIHNFTSLNIDDYDTVVLAIYRYQDVIHMIDNIEQVPIYWFNGLESTIVRLHDVFRDNVSGFVDDESVLSVVYDLRVSPPTYDFLVFLVRSKLEAIDRGLISLNVIVCPGDNAGFRQDIDFFSLDEMNFRITNLFLPLVKLVDPKASFHFCQSRKSGRQLFSNAANKFPKDHNFYAPVARHFYYEMFDFIEKGSSHAILRATPYYQKKVIEWGQTRNIQLDQAIVITLRESAAHSSRNSNILVWQSVSQELVKRGYPVVVLRDTDKALTPIKWQGVEHFSEASMSVNLRFALYDLCRVNLAVSNGAHSLCSLSLCRYILFGMLDESCTATTESHLKKIGMTPGHEQRYGASQGQYICWEQPTVSNILSTLFGYFDKGLL